MPDQVKQAIQLIEAGKFDQAHTVLLERLKAKPKDDQAWFWMSKVVGTDDLREECLREALKYNPKNTLASAALDALKGEPVAPTSKWSSLDSSTPKAKTKGRSLSAGPRQRPNTIPAAVVVFVLALALAAATYLFTREDLAYRAEGRIMNATVTHLNKERGSQGVPDRCQADYQFMAYAALRKGTLAFPCSDWNRLDDTRQLQIQYLASQPDHSRVYPPAETTERYAVLGFGLAILLFIVGIVLIVWKFLPQSSPELK